MLLAKVWYFATSGGGAFILPYFNPFFESLGFSKEQIGLLSALRPWLCAPCAVLLCSLADKLHAHTALLVVTFAASLLLRCLLLFVPAKFVAVAALVLLSDCIGSPVGAIVDATVVGACQNDGEYGKHRMWASAGWGGLSVIAGWLVAKKGMEAGFVVYFIMSAPCIFIALKLRQTAGSKGKETAACSITQESAEAVTGISKGQPGTANAAVNNAAGSTKQMPIEPVKTMLASAAATSEQEALAKALMARLLPATPGSQGSPYAGSSYGGSTCGGCSSCGGSRAGSPEMGMVRCSSPFSRFCAEPYHDSSDRDVSARSAAAAAARAGNGRSSTGAVSSQGNTGTAAAAAAGEQDEGGGLIKAWYQQRDEEGEEEECYCSRDGPGFVPGPAEAELLDLQESNVAASAGADVAGTTTTTTTTTNTTSSKTGCASAGVAGVLVVVATKQSAHLETCSSAAFVQPSYSQVCLPASTHADDGNTGTPTTPVAGAAAAAAAEYTSHAAHDGSDESEPLLLNSSKQPIPAEAQPDKQHASEAAAAATATATAAAGPGAGVDEGQSDVTIRSLLMQPAVVVFMWRALVIGLGLGVIGSFLFIHVEELGGTGTLMGLMLAFNCITEVPAFHFQSLILDKLPVPLVLNASMLLLAIRLTGYGLLPWLHSPWPVLGLEVLHGCTFATSWGAGIVYCKRLVPEHLNASMQGLFSSVYGGVGVGLGALLGGIIFEAVGGQALFFISSVIVLAGWMIGYAAELLLGRS